MCMFNSLPRCGAKAAAPSSPIVLPAHTTKHTHITNQESHHSATTNAYLKGPTCAGSTACPGVEPKLPLPRHRSCCLLTQPNTRTSPITNQYVHKPHHSATINAYLKGPTCACSTACPGVEPKLPLPRHRSCSLITQPNTRTSRITNQYVQPNTRTSRITNQHVHNGATIYTYVQGSTCTRSTACPGVGPKLPLPCEPLPPPLRPCTHQHQASETSRWMTQP